MEKLNNQAGPLSNFLNSFKAAIIDYKDLLQAILLDEALLINIEDAFELVSSTLLSGSKLILAGNGGSAAEASHIAAEYVVRFKNNRIPLPAINLCGDTSTLTAISNDFGFEHIFSRQIKAYAQAGDLVVLYTTSGTSKNILNAIHESQKLNLNCLVFTSIGCDLQSTSSRLVIKVPSSDVAEIQQIHNLIGHLICSSVEQFFASNQS